MNNKMCSQTDCQGIPKVTSSQSLNYSFYLMCMFLFIFLSIMISVVIFETSIFNGEYENKRIKPVHLRCRFNVRSENDCFEFNMKQEIRGEPGQLFIMLGESGSGKTTFLENLAGFANDKIQGYINVNNVECTTELSCFRSQYICFLQQQD
eukprot:UN32697